MTKAKPMTPKSAASTPKGSLKGVKDSPIGKNKTPKFKATPSGKVPLINGSPKGKMNKNAQNNTPKGKMNVSNTPKKGNSPNKQNGVKNEKKPQNGKQNTPQSKKNTPKGKSPAPKQDLSEEQLKAKVAKMIDEDSDEDDEDINEGVQINEEVSEEDDSDDDAESNDESTGVENILGNSLADDSDDDDEDFDDDDDDEDEDEDEDMEHKGVKMFKGLKPTEDEEDEEDSDDEEDDEANASGPGLKALLGNSLADDDDDEDFEEGDEDDEDEDISDEDEDEDEGSSVKKQTKVVADDDDDDEEADSEDEEDDAKTAKLATLEEDDDEDSEDDDAEEADSEGEAGKSKLTQEEKDERDRRTIYVGNVPKDTDKGTLKKLFRKFGEIENLRIRGVVPEDSKMSPRVATITKKIHPNVTTVHVFITFKALESAKKALKMNGQTLEGNFLRVDLAKHDNEKPDLKKAVFLGNLPFRIEDNAIWTHFGDCGKIESVRVVKDRRTGIGKGFGYINFDSTDAVTLALKLNGTQILNREIRVKPCTVQPPKNTEGNKNKKPRHQKPGGKRPHPGSNQDGGSPKKFKEISEEAVATATHNSQNAERRKDMKQNRSQGEKQRQKGSPDNKPKLPFQGQKADAKKKQKFNKGDKKKKQMAAKLAAKPKKASAN